MRRITRFCPVATALAAIAALAFFPRSAEAIIGGEVDGNNHRNVGALVYVNPPASRPDLEVPRVHFSGTLIHPRVFLTTGHRTSELQAQLADGVLTLDDVRVSFGPQAYDPDTWLRVCDVITHPDFDPAQDNGAGTVPMSDVGVLILCDEVSCVTPATPAPQFFLDFLDALGALQVQPEGAPFTVVGYGITEVHGSPVRDGLRRAAVSEFQNLHDEWLRLSQNFSQGEGGTGYGDAGAPVFWVDPDTGEELLVALTSRGDAELVANSLNYRVDIPETLKFLDLVIEVIEADGP